MTLIQNEYFTEKRWQVATSKEVFCCEQRSRFIFRCFTLHKSLKIFLAQYMLAVWFIITQTLITITAYGGFFKKILKNHNLREIRSYYFTQVFNDEIIINTKTHFYMNDFFQNYFALKMILLNILQNIAIYLFKYFALNTMIMFWNDAFPY